MTKADNIVAIAKTLASEDANFFEKRGPGTGNRATNDFMDELGRRVSTKLPNVVHQKKFCDDNNFAVDFYLPDEETVVEIAMSLRNSPSEFERDIFKCASCKCRRQQSKAPHITLQATLAQ